uniref:Uncharacterized protein n=1 Tax=Oryza brachyantha TaxID=4533 RepID=J3MBC8_ORYBR
MELILAMYKLQSYNNITKQSQQCTPRPHVPHAKLQLARTSNARLRKKKKQTCLPTVLNLQSLTRSRSKTKTKTKMKKNSTAATRNEL